MQILPDATLQSASVAVVINSLCGEKKSHFLAEKHTKLHEGAHQPSMQGSHAGTMLRVHSSGGNTVTIISLTK